MARPVSPAIASDLGLDGTMPHFHLRFADSPEITVEEHFKEVNI